jgi:murein DD-endopeptidase MepM/ murein hydrolase activator NlpD
MQVYIVKKGDTMWDIARRYKISLQSLTNANKHIKNPHWIYVGNKLNIPVPSTPKKPTPAKKPPAPAKPAVPPTPAYAVPPTARLGSSPAGTAKIKGTFDAVSFSFNPEEISVNKGNVFDYTEPSNFAYPVLHFKHGKTPTLRFELYVNDREEQGAVRRLIDKLNRHLPQEEYRKGTFRPVESMVFSFGKHFCKRVWLEDYTERRIGFNKELQCQEALVSVSLIIHTG